MCGGGLIHECWPKYGSVAGGQVSSRRLLKPACVGGQPIVRRRCLVALLLEPIVMPCSAVDGGPAKCETLLIPHLDHPNMHVYLKLPAS